MVIEKLEQLASATAGAMARSGPFSWTVSFHYLQVHRAYLQRPSVDFVALRLQKLSAPSSLFTAVLISPHVSKLTQSTTLSYLSL